MKGENGTSQVDVSVDSFHESAHSYGILASHLVPATHSDSSGSFIDKDLSFVPEVHKERKRLPHASTAEEHNFHSKSIFASLLDEYDIVLKDIHRLKSAGQNLKPTTHISAYDLSGESVNSASVNSQGSQCSSISASETNSTVLSSEDFNYVCSCEKGNFVQQHLVSCVYNKKTVSRGIQVSLDKFPVCNICQKIKYPDSCNCTYEDKFEKDFKAEQKHSRFHQLKKTTSLKGISYCISSGGCCCVDRTLSEAVMYHRPSLIKRSEARQQEIIERKKKVPAAFTDLHFNSESMLSKLPSSRLGPKRDRRGLVQKPAGSMQTTAKIFSYKWTARNKKQLHKYYRITAKLYSKKLKEALLKGKLNHKLNEHLLST